MPHKYMVRPKTDPTAQPFEITVGDNVGDDVAARAHVALTSPRLVIVDAPAADGAAVPPKAAPAPVPPAPKPDAPKPDAPKPEGK